MEIAGLAHVVLHVRNRERSEAFYNGLLGLTVAARYEPVKSSFFTLGDDHHCLAVIEVGEDWPKRDAGAPGLRHIAFRLNATVDDLPDIKRGIEAAGARIQKMLDHGITQSLYVLDPDDNVVELYVDISDEWRENPDSIVTTPKPLQLD